MADMHSRWINGQICFYDTDDYRLVDAIGPNVKKACFDFAGLPVDDTTGDPTAWTLTPIEVGDGDSVAVLVDNALKITNAGNEDDGVNLQLKGEAFKLLEGKPLYFGIKLQVSEATQSDLFAGLIIGGETSVLDGVSDGIYFEKLDGVTGISCVTELDADETQTDSAGTLAATTDIILEFWAESNTSVKFFINGVLVATHTVYLPTDEYLTPTIEYLNGSAGAKTCTVQWLRAIQIN